jgi:outer membrane protein
MTGMAAAILLAATGYAADFKVAVVDMQRALNECEAGKHAKDQVKAKFEKAQDQLKRQRDDLDRARDDFDKKALVLKEDQRRDLEKEFEVKSLDFKRKYEDFQRDLKRTDSELTSGIVEQLYGVVGEIGQQKGYTMVLESSSGAL